MTAFLWAQGVRIFDYPRFAEPLRDRIRARAAELASAAGVTIDHIAKRHIRKEDIPGVSSIAFGAQPPDLRFAPLMDMDFAIRCSLVRRWRLVSGFCSSARTFVPRFLQTPPRGDSPCASLTLHLHQVG
jgi:hypothetical protein